MSDGAKHAHVDTLVSAAVVVVVHSAQMSDGDMATDHVNGNGTEGTEGTEEPMDTTAPVSHSEHFEALIEAGLPQKVAEKLDELYVAGKLWRSPVHVFACFGCARITASLHGLSSWHCFGS